MPERIDELNTVQLDFLTEISSIGSGNAVTALSQLLNRKVTMAIHAAKFVPFKEASDFAGGAEQIVLGVVVNLSGDLDGIMMFLIGIDAAKKLLGLIIGEENISDGSFSEFERSTATEIGNILNSSYLSSLSSLTSKKINQSVPYCSVDMANAILSVPAIEFGKVSDSALFIDSAFEIEGVNIKGYFILVPDMQSFNGIFASFGVM